MVLATDQPPVLAIQDLQIDFSLYEGLARVVAGLDLHVRPGEKVALVGESGCGKSLSARAVLRLLPPGARVSGGRILFDGTDVLRLSDAEMQSRIRGRGVAMVFQDPLAALNPVFTVEQQLSDVLRWQGRSSAGWLTQALPGLFDRRSDAVRRRIVELLDRVRIPFPEQTMKAYPVQLSGGMCQRVLIALALANNPKLLIADEPTTALDVSIQQQILELFNTVVQEVGTGLLYITHDLGVAKAISQRIYVMYAGRVVETAPTEDLFRRQFHPYTKGLLGSVPRLTGEVGEGIEGGIPDYVHPPPGCRFEPRCPERLPVCARARPPEVDLGGGHRAACFLYAPDAAPENSGSAARCSSDPR